MFDRIRAGRLSITKGENVSGKEEVGLWRKAGGNLSTQLNLLVTKEKKTEKTLQQAWVQRQDAARYPPAARAELDPLCEDQKVCQAICP